MVGLVIVSHSQPLAESIMDLTRMMAPQAHVAAAGGLEDGTFGTSYEKIMQAIQDVSEEDGVVVLMDMGSAVMTTEMVIEDLDDPNIRMLDVPVVEGAVAGSVAAGLERSLDEVISEINSAKTTPKF